MADPRLGNTIEPTDEQRALDAFARSGAFSPISLALGRKRFVPHDMRCQCYESADDAAGATAWSTVGPTARLAAGISCLLVKEAFNEPQSGVVGAERLTTTVDANDCEACVPGRPCSA
jgi:hypothetical protein